MAKQKTVLVTGATGVLGSAIVAALCARDHRVIANFFHDETRAWQLADATGCALYRADVRDQNAVQTLFESANFDAVIHAAGANSDALLLRTSAEMWRAQMRWLDAAFLVARASLEKLPHDGALMLISSRVGEHGFAGQSAYATQKGAMLGLMRAAAAERPDLRINALCPGFAASEMSHDLSDALRRQRAAHDLLPAADARQSLAAMCVFLLNSSQSGQVLRPDCRV